MRVKRDPLTVLTKKHVTFTDYFKSRIEAPDLVASFGYRFQSQPLAWPKKPAPPQRVQALQERIRESQPYVNFTSEMARREFLIAPVLAEVIHATHVRLSAEYALEVDDRLRGTLDYFLRGDNKFLVIEAKNGDLERGFAQLAVELIALDKWLEEPQPRLPGAVSMGNIWQFGLLSRQQKLITQDTHLFRVPEDLTDLLGVLIAILKGDEAAATKRKK